MNELIKQLNTIDYEKDFDIYGYENTIDDYDNMINESYEDDEEQRGY